MPGLGRISAQVPTPPSSYRSKDQTEVMNEGSRIARARPRISDPAQVRLGRKSPSPESPRPRSCAPQAVARHEILRKLYSTCASPVVPHPSTGHAHGCLASEIGRDPAFPTRFDRTVASPEVSLLAPSRLGRDCGKRDDFSKENIIKEI